MRRPLFSLLVCAVLFVCVTSPVSAAVVARPSARAQQVRLAIQRQRLLRRLLHKRTASVSAAPAAITAHETQQTITRPSTPPPAVSASSASSSSVAIVPVDIPEELQEVVRLVNQERAKVGLPPLHVQPLLQKSAQAYAQDMRQRNFFSHEDPEGNHSTERMKAMGYVQTPHCDCAWHYWTGENLAKGQTTPREVMHDWMASEGHRANILQEHFTDIGIGRSGDYWVQHFGSIVVEE